VIYPFAKRFTWWPQAFLGVAFNWGALLAYAASAGEIVPAAVFAYLGGMAWTLFYDTIYAYQDVEDDALIGVRSTARRFGDRPLPWMRAFLMAAVGLISIAALVALPPVPGAVAMLGAWAMGWHLTWQLAGLDIADPQACLRLFRSNQLAGLIPLPFFAVAALV
jgi:4-hydroxybenzoate polyprenyltransferase